MGRLTAIVLGSAAGGGYPQWNCRCPVCCLAWQGDTRVSFRTQASLAVSADGEHWVLLNAAPELRTQIAATPALHPRTGLRDSPLAAVILTGGEIDQTAGLLNLRERQPFTLHATADTLRALADNPMFAVLAPDVVVRRAVPIGEPFALPGDLTAELFLVPGKVPLYLERGTPRPPPRPAPMSASRSRAGCASGLRARRRRGHAGIEGAFRRRRYPAVRRHAVHGRRDDRDRTGQKTGRRMGHMPIDGDDGSLAMLGDLGKRSIYIHINNTNPILVDGSPERRRVEAAGWEVAADGQQFTL